MPEFYSKLKFQQSLLTLLLALMLGFAILGLFSIVVLLCQLLNSLTPMQETTAWKTLIGLGLCSIALAIGGLLWLAFKRPRMADLARIVEGRHPDLNETLTTALEIQERGGPSNPLEEALFRQVEGCCAEINLKRDALPRLVNPAVVIGLIAAAMLLSDYAGNTEFVMKARMQQLERMEGEMTGLLVEPGDAEVPRNDDLRILVDVMRWENDPIIIYRQNGEEFRYPMTLQTDVSADFTFFGLAEPLEYRIQTSSLRSPWYTVGVYDPPEIEALTLTVTPPAYTKEESTGFSRLVDLHVPEGSQISLSLTTQALVTGQLRWSGEALPLQAAGSGALQGQFTVETDGDYQVILENSEGRRLVTPSFDLDVIPDEPPMVEITDPGQDTQSKPDGALPFSVFSGDDYGVSRLELYISVSGLPRSPKLLFEARGDAPLEREVLGALELAKENAEHGDIVTYYVVAWDNRAPEPQSARSDVFFIEVLTDIPDQESESQEGGGEGEKEEIDLRAIIVELKRLMRESHAAGSLALGPRRDEAMQALAKSIAAVRKETGTSFEKMSMMFMQMAMQGDEDGRAMADMLINAMESMVDAEQVANEGDPELVTPHLAEALSQILIVESYLRAHQQQQQGSSGQGQPSESTAEGESGQQKGESESQGKSQQPMSMAELQQALEDLNHLVDDQATQNADYARADGQSLSEAELNELLGQQVEIDNQVGILEDALKRRMMEVSAPARASLKDAQASMRAAAQATQQKAVGAAGRNGMRAQNALMEAAGILGGLIQEQANGAMAGLSRQVSELVKSQSAAGQASANAASQPTSSEQASEMRQQQEGVRQQYEQLLADMSRQAVELESVIPEAGEALSQAVRNARRANTEGEMQRAVNALLYERFARAEKHQASATQQLQDLQTSLNAAAQEMPGMGASQLRQLAQQIAQAQQSLTQGKEGSQRSGDGDTEGASEGSNTAQAMQQLGRRLGQAGQSLRNETLTELGENLEASQDGTGSGLTQARLGPTLDQAARIIQQYLRSELVGDRLQLNRATAPPPEQYRRLVEEYFKDLAEQP